MIPMICYDSDSLRHVVRCSIQYFDNCIFVLDPRLAKISPRINSWKNISCVGLLSRLDNDIHVP